VDGCGASWLFRLGPAKCISCGEDRNIQLDSPKHSTYMPNIVRRTAGRCLNQNDEHMGSIHLGGTDPALAGTAAPRAITIVRGADGRAKVSDRT